MVKNDCAYYCHTGESRYPEGREGERMTKWMGELEAGLLDSCLRRNDKRENRGWRIKGYRDGGWRGKG